MNSLMSMSRRASVLEAGEARFRRELAEARRVQESLLPHGLPELAGLTLAAVSYPAEQVSGDLYDLIELSDGQLFAVVADACGKSLPAALLAAAVQQGIRRFAGPDPAAVLAELNQVIRDNAPDDMFVTAACAVIEPRSGAVAVATAGHPPPFWWDHATGRLAPARGRGPILGLMPQWSGSTQRWRLAPGDGLLLYTDGVLDAWTGPRARLGEERLLQQLRQAPSEDAEGWLTRLVDTLNECTEWPDDITAVTIVRGLDTETREAA